MWYLVLLTFCNAALDQKGVLLERRINVGPFPINILDGLLALGVICAILGPLFVKSRYPTKGAHPAYLATLLLFAIAIGFGLFGGLAHGGKSYNVMSDLRNAASFPLSLFACYFFVKSPRSSLQYAYVYAVAGALTAGLILLFFIGKSTENTTGEVEQIRAIQYVSWYAGMAAAFLLFTALNKHARFLPIPLTIMGIVLCLVGQFGTLSRSDWIATMGAIFVIPFLFERGHRMVRLTGFLLAIPIMIAVLWGGTAIASKITHRDLTEHMSKRIMTLLPGRGDDSYDSRKAWDTRVPGMIEELKYFSKNPLTGQGFAYTSTLGLEGGEVSFYHNVWASQPALMGIFGFAAFFTPVIAVIVVGRRMVFDAVDKGSVLMGALGVVTGVFALIIGAATMSLNVERGALAFAPVIAIVLKTRMMQLETIKQFEGYESGEVFLMPESQYA